MKLFPEQERYSLEIPRKTHNPRTQRLSNNKKAETIKQEDYGIFKPKILQSSIPELLRPIKK